MRLVCDFECTGARETKVNIKGDLGWPRVYEYVPRAVVEHVYM